MSNPYLDALQSTSLATGSAAPPNPYLNLLQADEEARKALQAAQLSQAVKVDPNQYSAQRRVAGYLGYPVAAVEALPELADQAKVRKVQQDTVSSPLLQQRYSDADFAKLAHDDSGTLSQLGKFVGDLGGTIKAGVFRASRGAAGTFQAGLELVAPLFDALEPDDPMAPPRLSPRIVAPLPGGNPLRRLAEGFAMQGEAAGRTAALARPKTDGIVAGGFFSGVESLTQNLMTLPMAFLPGGQAAALTGMTAFTGGDAYQQAREKGLPMSQALPFAASQAAIEYATEKLPLANLLKDVRAGAGFLRILGRQIALEVPGEQIATVLQDLNEWAVLNPEKPFSSYLEERPSAAAQTLIATIVGTGGNVAVVKGLETMMSRAVRDGANMQQAGLVGQALEQALRGAEASLLRERSPEQFRTLMSEMSEDGSLYVDAAVLNQMPAEVLAQLPGVAEALQTATADTPVEVKLADALTVLPGTPEAQVFMQNARTAPDAPSLAEAEEAGKKAQEFLQQEAARVIAQAQDQEALRQSQEVVKQNIRQQLAATGRFRDTVNEGYATWAAAFYTAYGSRLGMTPEQFYQRYPLRVLGAPVGQQTGVLNAGMTLRTVNVGDTVDGRVVRDGVPNLESIGSSLDNYEVLPGVREVPMSAFDPEYVGGISMDRLDERTRRLADEIRASGEITPLIVVQDAQGMYVLEGGHRLDALIASGAQSLPAVVVIDQDNPPGQVLNQSVTTMVPTTKGAVVDPAIVKVPGIAEAEANDPKAKAALEANVGLFDKKVQVIADKEKRGYDSIKPAGDTPKDRAESIIDQMVRNLLTIYDAIPAAIRNRSRLWYDGANRISLAFAQRYDMTPMQSAAQLAVLSPQADWFMNVSYAERINDILDFRQDHTWDAEMDAWATEWIANSEESRQKESERRAEAVREAQRALVEAERAKARADAALEKNTPKLTEKITSAEEALKAAEQAVKDAKKTGTPAALKRAEAQRDKRNEAAKAARQALRDAKGAVSKAETAIRQASRKLQEKTDYAAEPDPNLAVQPNIRGKKLSELQTDFERAWWVRAYDEAHHPRAYRVVTPEGGFLDFAKLDDGVSNDSIAWKSFSPIAKAISIRRDGSLANVHAMLGGEHKVRNFYNNIYAPNAPFPFVTSDTHQVAANLFLPLGADALEVGQNFGGTGTKSVSEIGLNGTYWLYSEAVAKAAKQRGVLPREMQSISWEAIRSLFSPTFKANSDSVNAVRDLWVRHHAGEASYEDTIAAIIRLAGGRYRDPSWVGVRPDSAAAPEAGLKSYESQLAHARQGLAQRGEPGRGDAGVPGAALSAGGVDGQRPLEQAGDGAGRSTGAGPAPLPGAPIIAGATGPDPRIVAVAEQYARDNGIPLRRQGEYAKVDPERAARIAAAYDAMAHAPQDPAVREAYENLIQQTRAQYDALVAAGYKFWFIDPTNDPYKSPWDALRDLRATQSMGVFPTAAGFGSAESDSGAEGNPMESATGIMWPYGSPDGELKPVLANDLFRAVHDAFGHGLEGAGFREQGEENAWQAHIRLFTGSAKGAITSETRGQNSWLNFGPYGESNRTAKVEDTVFADQKTGLMPEWTWTEGIVEDMPEQPLAQGARGTFNPQTLELVLNPNADLSTWFHETGHFFLEVLADVASQPDAPAQIVEDYNKVLAWFGVTPEQWAGFTLDQKRPYHERWAESIEQYVMEGKAPSVELQPVMRRFRAWLTSVYQSIKQFLAQRGVPVAGGQDLAQPAFHGTPQLGITQFSTDFVGTGEGAQAYGWGLYFAGMREIAEFYREKLTGGDLFAPFEKDGRVIDTGVDLAEAYYRPGKIVRGYSGADKVLEFRRTDNGGWAVKVVGVRANGEPMSSERPRWHSTFPSRTDLKLDLEADGWKAKTPGQLYEVEIPEDSEMLLWDKPLSEQPEKVRAMLASYREPTTLDAVLQGRSIKQLLAWVDTFDRNNSFGEWVDDEGITDPDVVRQAILDNYSTDDMGSYLSSDTFEPYRTGESMYREIASKRGSDRAASEALLAAGIKGIKYLDGGSRADGDGTYNYVVFSGDDVAIRNQFYQGGEQQPLNIQLNDDIRRVMDRMLATDEQIAQANEVAGLMPDEQADAEAAERLQKRSMADLKWAVKARDKVIAKLKRQAREIEKAIREQVTVEVDQMPEMRAKAKLDELRKTSPEYKAALKAWQTQRQAAKDAAAQSIRDNLLATEGAGLKGLEKGQFLARKKREIENQAEAAALAWEADNAKPERPLAASDLEVAAIADSFGYESVDQMLQAIDAFGKRADAIDGLTEQRMLEEHGDLVDEAAIQEAANEAVHNEARARSLATELRTQREMLGGRTDTGEVNARGARITVNTLVEAAKQFGANVIARTPLKDLRSTAWKHTAAERRAGKRWAEATAAGDTQAAVQAKQDQVLNNAAAKAALDAAAEAKKILEFFRRVTKGNDEKTVEKGRDPDIVNAARAVLAAYGIETPTTKGAAAYLEAVKTNDPDTYAAIEPMITAATQNAQPLEALTFEELQGLAESIQAMWHLAKRSRQMEVDGDLLDIDDVATELFVRLEQIGIPDRVPGEGMAVTREEERGLFLKQGIAFLRRVEQWAEGMDGKYGGPFLRFIFQPIKDAADRYRAERITYRKKFQALVDNLAPIVGDSVIDAPELGYKFGTPGSTAGTAMNEILHALAHTGNESNKRKLLLGRGWATENPDGTIDTSRWDAFIRRLVNEGKLERAHYDFVQGVWDLLEETKPLAQKAHRDAFGRYFSEVTADAFVDPFGVTRRGGYVPAQVDSRLVKDNVLRKMAEEENNSMAYAFPQPAKGFTMARTEYNRPLMLDLRSLSQHLDKVLLFSHMTNPARDVRKLLTRKTVSQPLDRIQPAAIESMLQPWLQRSAQQIVETPIVGSGKWARLPGLIRSRAGMALMFANVSNAIQQVTGLAGAAVRVKPSMLMRSVAQYVANPVQFSRAVWDASPYMDDRAKNEVAVMNEQMQTILLKPSTYEKVQDWSMRHAYFLQTALDNVLSPIVWTGAFNQALAEGMSDADAVRFADSTVRQTQGSTLPEDVSRFETGPAYARAFTQFVGYFNMMANTNGTALKQIANEVGLKKGAGKALYVVLMGLMVPIWVAEAIALAFKGGPEDEDDDGYLDDWLASVFGMGTSKGLLAQIPILGQFAVAAIQRFNDNPLDDRVSLSPAISLLESSVGAPQSVYKAIVEDGSAQKAIRDVATLVSVATGVPVYGLARPVGYAAGVAQGKIEPTSAADAARGVVTGTASPESKQR